MPELPEVETVRRAMDMAMTGRTIKTLDQRRPDLRVPFPANFKQALEGRRISNIARRAKYILIHLDCGNVVILHLGMSGRVLLLSDAKDYAAEKHDHLIMSFDDGGRFVFNDARRFGMVMMTAAAALEQHKSFAGLGPEPLENVFSGPVLYEALQGRRTSIKAALLDQRIVAGLGNIYVSEALFYAGIAPQRRAGDLSAEECEALAQAIRKVLNEAIAAGGSTLRDYKQASGDLGYFQHQFAVYDKAGRPCPGCTCDVSITGGVRKIVQGGRSTYFCSVKQI